MKFAIISDIHLGLEKCYENVPTDKTIKLLLDNFVEEINADKNIEFVVNLGDLIEEYNEAVDNKNIYYIVNLFKKLNCPVHYLAGNHDLKHISTSHLTKLFNQEKLYFSFDSNQYHFIVLFSEKLDSKTIIISDEQIKWLKLDLNNTNKKTLVFSHHGLANQDLLGNPWYDGNPNECFITNREEIRNILSESDKVIAVFNGHAHWDKKNIHNNIPYFSINSLSDNSNEKKVPSEACAIVNIKNNKVNVEIKGQYPKYL